jgi:hypothetical protein
LGGLELALFQQGPNIVIYNFYFRRRRGGRGRRGGAGGKGRENNAQSEKELY